MNPFKLLKDEVAAYLCALLLVGLVVLAVAFWMYRADAGRKLDKAKAEVAQVEGELNSCLVDLQRAHEVVQMQNDAVIELERRSEEAKAKAAEAQRQAKAQAKQYEDRIARLRAARSGPDACLSARTLIVDTLKEDRK